MELKRNEATINRPEGDRVLDACYVFVDLPDFLRQLKDEKSWEKNDRNGITVFKTENLTITLTAMHQGATIPDNKVDGLLTLQVIEGSLNVNTVDGDVTLEPLQLVTLHSHQTFSITAKTEAAFLIWNFTGSNAKEDQLL